MSNPYTQPTLSGYNSTPPADDGTSTTTNLVKWSNHIDKIGDPLKAFAQGVDSNTLAAFGLTYGASVLSKTSAYTVATTDRGRFISVTNATTITLLPAATAGDGFPLLIVNTGTAIVTVDGDGSETINGSTTQEIYPGSGLILNSNNAAWFGISVVGSQTGSFTATLTGYAVSPTGTVHYRINGNLCTLFCKDAAITGTSNANTFTMTGVPAACTPQEDSDGVCLLEDEGGTRQGGFAFTATVSTITFIIQDYSATTGNMASNLFATSGSKGIGKGWQITYALR